ncbi:MAG: Maf family protein [Candidatus Marinimicrobia bacterium]|nr:Maf family protein [Candidatus Neomarinimicrobiota bacterium]MCF7839304.1 Maf family protein [Candidatus Neomarinimicrobiota bacterium]
MIPTFTCPITLASQSPRRIELLHKIGLEFSVHPAGVPEPPAVPGENPLEYAQKMALMKARKVADELPDHLVIGADTVVVVAENILGKPATDDEAREMLNLLANRWHLVTTAYAMVKQDQQFEFAHQQTTRVHFRALSTAEIEHYINTGSPFDKAGAYGIQDYSAIFVDAIDGCFYNVVGLPLSHLVDSLIIVSDQLSSA